MRAETAHHADVGLDAVEAQAGALHDAVVRGDVELVALLEPRGVAVERVGVLHDELARAQDAGARARLVALLDLDVVEDQRQVAIGADDLRDVQRDRLLVRHREHEIRALAVGELEQRLDVVAARSPPDLGWLEHGHQHLLAPDRVYLLADDRYSPLMHPPPGWQPRPHPRTHLPDQAGAHHQLVRDGLGVGGSLLLGRKQVGGEPRHRDRSLAHGGRSNQPLTGASAADRGDAFPPRWTTPTRRRGGSSWRTRPEPPAGGDGRLGAQALTGPGGSGSVFERVARPRRSEVAGTHRIHRP